MEVSQASRLQALQTQSEPIADQIKGLKAKLITVTNAASEYSQYQRSVSQQIQTIEILQSKIHNSANRDQAVYLRHSERNGIKLCAHRGLKERLCMSSGGAPRAVEMVKPLVSEALGNRLNQKISLNELNQQLGMGLEELQQQLQAMREGATTARQARKSIEQQLDALDKQDRIERQRDSSNRSESLQPCVDRLDAKERQAMKEAAVLIYGSNEGANYVNYLRRQEKGVWQGQPAVKPSAAKIYAFYERSSSGSAYRAMTAGDRRVVNRLLGSPTKEILRTFDEVLADPSSKKADSYENFRGARITTSELACFERAFASKSLLKNAFYMSVAPDSETAKRFATGMYHEDPKREISVLFKVQAPSIEVTTAYEVENIVKPDTCFEVTTIKAPFKHGNTSARYEITLTRRAPTPQATQYF